MSIVLGPLLRQLGARFARGLCANSSRLAVIVGIAVAIASSAHAAVAPFQHLIR